MKPSLRGIQNIYREVAGTYERVNHVLTFGCDVLWRRRAARLGARATPARCLDVCSGTGEMAAEMAGIRPAPRQVLATDVSADMLMLAKAEREALGLRFARTDAARLPFADQTFDVVTISFATRNLHRDRETLAAYFREFHRVLRPGGLFINLETSQPQSRIWRALFHLYIRLAVRPIGRLLSGSRSGYAYLAYTIPRFYDERQLTALLGECGFPTVAAETLLGGIAAIHVAKKQP